MSERTTARVLGPTDGETGSLGSIGVRFMIAGKDSGEHVSLVEHPMPARALAAPMHRHSREDEYSFVLEGRVGAQLGDELIFAGQGDLVFKPRDQWHTFWNAGDESARILEVISPAGFERFFKEIVDRPTAEPELAAVGARYGLEFDFDSVAHLVAEHGLRFGST